MKKILFIVLIGVVFVGCDNSLELTKENLEGNWYYCDEGLYTEVYIKEDKIVYFMNGSLFDFTFKLGADSVFTYNASDGKLNGIMNIKISKNYSFTEKWADTNNLVTEHIVYKIQDSIMSIYDFNRIAEDGDSLKNYQLFELFEEGYFKRSEKSNCN